MTQSRPPAPPSAVACLCYAAGLDMGGPEQWVREERPVTVTSREELAYIESEDGLTLEGAVIRPAEGASAAVIVWVHGLTGRFYERHTVRIGRALASAGHTFVTGNNRGHDFGTLFRVGGERLLAGGAWERFSESARDVAAWVRFGAGLGDGRVILVGHSLGALKVGAYQATRHDPAVRAVVAASPPVHAGQMIQDVHTLAERMEAEGREQDLLPWGIHVAGGGTMSARTYLDRIRSNIDIYGSRTPEPAIAGLRCPLLAFFGTDEAWVGNADDLEMIRRNARAAARVETAMIEGADHVYTGHEQEVAALIATWITSLGGA